MFIIRWLFPSFTLCDEIWFDKYCHQDYILGQRRAKRQPPKRHRRYFLCLMDGTTSLEQALQTNCSYSRAPTEFKHKDICCLLPSQMKEWRTAAGLTTGLADLPLGSKARQSSRGWTRASSRDEEHRSRSGSRERVTRSRQRARS
jgi:hypothetical protein